MKQISNKNITFFLAPVLILGALTGSYILYLLPEEYLKWIVIAICFIGLVYMIYQTFYKKEKEYTSHACFIKHWKPIALIVGLSLGFYDGLSAAGSGILMILALTFIFRRDMKTTLVIANILSMISLFSAASVFLIVGLLSWKLQLIMIPACLIAGFLGARIVSIVPEKTLRVTYIFLVFCLMTYMLKDMIIIV